MVTYAVFFVAAACLCISDKLGDIQSIVRKTRDRISVNYLSSEWRSLDRIAKFASTIQTTGNSDNTSDMPVELRKFQDRWCSLFPWVTYETKENKMLC
jgi:hypothetical protein